MFYKTSHSSDKNMITNIHSLNLLSFLQRAVCKPPAPRRGRGEGAIHNYCRWIQKQGQSSRRHWRYIISLASLSYTQLCTHAITLWLCFMLNQSVLNHPRSIARMSLFIISVFLSCRCVSMVWPCVLGCLSPLGEVCWPHGCSVNNSYNNK